MTLIDQIAKLENDIVQLQNRSDLDAGYVSSLTCELEDDLAALKSKLQQEQLYSPKVEL